MKGRTQDSLRKLGQLTQTVLQELLASGGQGGLEEATPRNAQGAAAGPLYGLTNNIAGSLEAVSGARGLALIAWLS